MHEAGTPDLFKDTKGDELQDLIAKLAPLDRRIDNMRHLLAFKKGERAVIVEAIRTNIGQTTARTKAVPRSGKQMDATMTCCVICRAPLEAGQATAVARMTSIDGVLHVVHARDAVLADMAVLDMPGNDVGTTAIGLDCAALLGQDWAVTPQQPRKGPRGIHR